ESADVVSHPDVSNPPLSRLSALSERAPVIRSPELKKFGIHRQTLRRAADRGVLRRISWGLYVRPEILVDLKHRVILACKRVPHRVVCLESALRFHGLASAESDVLWMAIPGQAGD